MNDNTCGHECCSPDLEDGCTIDQCDCDAGEVRVTVWRPTTAAEQAQEFDLAIGKLRCIQRMSEEDIERLIADAKRAGETTTLTPLQALDRTIENQIRKLLAGLTAS